jgi:hypothetical protein
MSSVVSQTYFLLKDVPFDVLVKHVLLSLFCRSLFVNQPFDNVRGPKL